MSLSLKFLAVKLVLTNWFRVCQGQNLPKELVQIMYKFQKEDFKLESSTMRKYVDDRLIFTYWVDNIINLNSKVNPCCEFNPHTLLSHIPITNDVNLKIKLISHFWQEYDIVLGLGLSTHKDYDSIEPKTFIYIIEGRDSLPTILAMKTKYCYQFGTAQLTGSRTTTIEKLNDDILIDGTIIELGRNNSRIIWKINDETKQNVEHGLVQKVPLYYFIYLEIDGSWMYDPQLNNIDILQYTVENYNKTIGMLIFDMIKIL